MNMPVHRGAIKSTVILLLVLLGGIVRVVAYGDLRLSVGNGETSSYVDSSAAPLFSWKSFAGNRLFTTNLIYKLANNPIECKLSTVSYPASGAEVNPAIQPCFENIALLQNLLGIVAWCFLAWVTSRRLKNFAARVGVVIVILAYGFTPQIAEWDSILGPESLSFTLLVLLVALLQEVLFGIAGRRNWRSSRMSAALVAVWLAIFSLWVFLRDVNLLAVPVTLGLIVVAYFLTRQRPDKPMMASVVFLVGLLMLGYFSGRDSLRATHYPLVHSFEDYILPFPARVEFFSKLGMPEAASPDYQSWIDRNGTATYAAFLISHPGFVASSLWQSLFDFRAEFVQPYFAPRENPYRVAFLRLGEILHPEATAVYILDVVCIAALAHRAWKSSDPLIGSWAWIGIWLFTSSGLTLLASFFGDSNGFRRHLFPSVEPFRLLMWLLVFAILDEFAMPASTVHNEGGNANEANSSARPIPETKPSGEIAAKRA